MKAAPAVPCRFNVAVLVALSVCPAFAQSTAPRTTELEKTVQNEERITLTPFEVRDDKDTGFAASSSLAGARLSTPLKDTPVAYSVITAEFLDAFNICLGIRVELVAT